MALRRNEVLCQFLDLLSGIGEGGAFRDPEDVDVAWPGAGCLVIISSKRDRISALFRLPS